VSKGTTLLNQKISNQKIHKIKKVASGKKIGKKKIKDTSARVAKKVAKDSAKKTAKESIKIAAKVGSKVAGTTAGTVVGTAATGGAGPLIGIVVGEAVGIRMDIDDVKRTNRNRKIKFFLDKMKAENNQKDSLFKLLRDLFIKKVSIAVKYSIKYVGLMLLSFLPMFAVTVFPVVVVIVLIYNSPFALFFPPIGSGDTVMTITSQYTEEFKNEVNTLASNHIGYDEGTVVYVDYEGTNVNPSNYYDIMAVYMVAYGIGDTAIVMNDTGKVNLKVVFDDMCSYTTSSETIEVRNEDETITTTTILHVNVTLKSYRNMIETYYFSADEAELLEEVMAPENLALIGYINSGVGVGNVVSELSQEEMDAITSSITEEKAKKACAYALSKVGYPYSQEYRDTGTYYDCSSLAYYSWKAVNVNISFDGVNTAAAEAQGLYEAEKTVIYEELQPGDLIFYSYCSNGRFMDISHVAIYVGNGKTVEALNESVGVVYRELTLGSMVIIGRP
jgi:cell wall-associated NlpC family hydrolase